MVKSESSWCDNFCKEALDEIINNTTLSSVLFPDEIDDVIKAIDGALHSAWYNGYEHGELDGYYTDSEGVYETIKGAAK